MRSENRELYYKGCPNTKKDVYDYKSKNHATRGGDTSNIAMVA